MCPQWPHPARQVPLGIGERPQKRRGESGLLEEGELGPLGSIRPLGMQAPDFYARLASGQQSLGISIFRRILVRI